MQLRLTTSLLSVFLFLGTIIGQNNYTDDSLNRAYISAQIKNQLAQGEYYAQQGNSSATQWTTLIGALGGSIIGLFGAFILAQVNKKGENEKINKYLEQENIKNTKIAAADLMKKTAAGFHNMTWILWIAKNTPEECTAQIIDNYDKKMDKIYSEIVGAQVTLSAYSKEIYQVTEPIVRKLYEYDGDFSRITYNIKAGIDVRNSVSNLGIMWQEIYNYTLAIPKTFADSIELSLPQNSRGN